MAVIQKTLFPKNLDNYSVLVNDLDTNSKYFKITELSDTLTGGKNAFLIAGSEYLVPDTKIQIELKDSAGNIIYHEPGEGYFSSSFNGTPFVTEYYEGVSKVVSVYVYPDTAYGPCTITILGELNEYEDDNDMVKPIPMDWENKYNVKWQKTINVNPSLANTTKIRFYQRPTATIKEILSPIYRIENDIKVNSGVSQSFADIKLSKLETFAGDVKRIKVFRTSEGDISDYDLIQDILVESKELLTSYGLSGSVVGQTGILTSETLKSFWNTGSLNAFITSSRVESGVRLTGSGYFTYTSSLDIKSTNTYELNFDAFYSSSTASNLGIYLSWVSQSINGPLTFSSSLATLVGTTPTKNLLDTVIPFKIPTDYPSASLYFSQSQGEWHLGNISLKLSQDTAFSPDEISFVTTMPSVIGNETFNFKFEFYDVNNNYVPVAVTQSATFTGGVNVNNTLLLVSASASQTLAALAAVSSSISGTMTVYSSSASSSVSVLSGSVSNSINIVSSSVSSSLSSSFGFTSASVYTLSSSVSSSLTLTSGSITLVSSSLVFTSQSLNNSLTTLSSSLSSSFANATSQSAYQVYSASQYLDKFIFTDENGKLNKPPDASDPGLYLGSEYLGYYNAGSWRTYMDNQGDFYLTSSTVGGGFLAWDSSTATLQIQGAINIQGGNAATTSSVSTAATNAALSGSNAATNAALSGSNAATAVSNSLAPNIFTNANGLINRPPATLVGVPSGLYIGPTYLGYYNGSNWKTYMQDNGNFFLSGAGSDSLSWSGGVLSINGAINITGGNAATTSQVSNAASNAVTSGSNAASTAQSNAQSFASTAAGTAQSNAQSFASAAAINAVASGSAFASAVDDKVFTNALGRITKTPTPGSTSGLYLGNTIMGFYNGAAWKTYMDNTGLFYLTGSNNGNALLWDGSTLAIKGTIKVSDGTEVTPTVITNANSALQSGQTGKSLGLTGGSVGGVTIASTKIYVGTGTHGHANTGFYVDSDGKMSLKDKLVWDGTTLSITGDITVSAGPVAAAISNLNSTTSSLNSSVTNINSSVTNINSTTSSLNSSVSQINTATGSLTTAVNGKITAGGAAADVNSNTTTISGGKIRTGIIESTGYSYPGTGNFSTTGTQINLDNGLIRSKNFGITSAGDAYFKGAINGGTISIGSKFNVDSQGNVSATNAALTGSIVATSGKIGDWIINAGKLANSAGTITIDADGRSIIIYDGTVPKVSISGQTELTNPYANQINSGPHPTIGNVNTSFSETTTISTNTDVNKASTGWFGNIPINSGPQTISYYGSNIDMSSNSMPTGHAAFVTALNEGRPGIPGYASITTYIDFRNKSSNNIYSGQIQGGFYSGPYEEWDELDPAHPYQIAATYANSSTGLRNLIVSFNETGNYEWRIRVDFEYRAAGDMQSDNSIQYVSTTCNASLANANDYINVEATTNLIELTNRGFQVLNNQDNFVQIKRYDSSGVWNDQPLINVQGGQGIRSYGVDPGVGNSYGKCLDLKGRIDLSDVQGGGFYGMFPSNDIYFSNGTSAKRWTDVYAQNGTIQTSDRNQKKNIENSELGLQFINDLKPVKYKFIKNTNDRTHYGLIAQDVTSSLDKFNIDKKDFAGFISYNNYVSGSNEMTEAAFSKIENEDDKIGWNKVEKYSLRYDEFISPMIKAMQELSAKVQELEARLSGSI